MESNQLMTNGNEATTLGAQPLISVIVPVYDSMPYLLDLLDSLDSQTIDPKNFEVVIVDDGSTDSGPLILDEYAASRENVRVIHQANSGWAGKPRNTGMDAAKGRYFFFIDSDDWIGTEALERMKDFVLEHDPDVLAPRIVGVDGRKGGGQVFAKTIIDAPIDHMIKTLMPQKLIRAQLMKDYGIRFREDKVRLEDGMMLAQAYCVAQRNSVLGDYDYYFLRTRSDGANISKGAIDPFPYTESLKHIAKTLITYVQDTEYAHRLVAELFSRKGLKVYRGQRFLNYKESKRQDWITAHRSFLIEFLPKDLERFEGIRRAKVECILRNDHVGLLRLAQQEINEKSNPVLTNISTRNRQYVVNVEIPDYFSSASRLVGTKRKDGKRWLFESIEPISVDVKAADYVIQLRDLSGIVDLSLELDDKRLKRVVFPDGMHGVDLYGAKIYRTANGYASIDVRNIRSTVAQNLKKFFKNFIK